MEQDFEMRRFVRWLESGQSRDLAPLWQRQLAVVLSDPLFDPPVSCDPELIHQAVSAQHPILADRARAAAEEFLAA